MPTETRPQHPPVEWLLGGPHGILPAAMPRCSSLPAMPRLDPGMTDIQAFWDIHARRQGAVPMPEAVSFLLARLPVLDQGGAPPGWGAYGRIRGSTVRDCV